MQPLFRTIILLTGLLLVPTLSWAISPDSSGQLQKKVKVSENDSSSGYLNGKLVAGSNISFTENNDGGAETLTIAATGDLSYATVQEEGTPLTQRDTINFIGGSVTCADNSGTEATDCTFNPGSTITVQEGDVTKSTASTIDFNTGDFAVTESPSGEANVALGANIVTTSSTSTLTNKTLTTPVIGAIKPVAGSNSHTVPNVTSDTIALLAASQTLTNKTIGSATNTVDATMLQGVALNITSPASGATLTYNGSQWIDGGGSGYSEVQDETTPLTARTKINFTGAGVACADNAGTSTTDCTINAGAATIGVDADDVSVDASTTTIDFRDHFSVSSSPAGEANVTVKADSLNFTELADALTVDAATHITSTATNTLRIGDGSGDYRQFGLDGTLTYAGSGKPNRTFVLTPASGLSPASGGATKANTDGTNFSYPQATFPDASAAAMYWTIPGFPEAYDDGNLSCQIHWKTSSTTTSNVCRWQVAIRGTANDEVFDASLGSYVNIDDSPTSSANDLLVSTATAVTGAWTAGEYAVLKLYRDPADGADTLGADAVFLGMKCEYIVDQETD